MEKHCWNNRDFSAGKAVFFLDAPVFPGVNDNHKLCLC